MWAEFCDIYADERIDEWLEDGKKVIEINGVEFYYNSKELNIDDYIEV